MSKAFVIGYPATVFAALGICYWLASVGFVGHAVGILVGMVLVMISNLCMFIAAR